MSVIIDSELGLISLRPESPVSLMAMVLAIKALLQPGALPGFISADRPAGFPSVDQLQAPRESRLNVTCALSSTRLLTTVCLLVMSGPIARPNVTFPASIVLPDANAGS